jgi:hypothetical protein
VYCNSNNETVAQMLFKEFAAKGLDAASVKVLGLTWLIREDCFQFEGIVIPPELKCTKINVLSLIARMFDPLGLLIPFDMLVKILFQNIWKLGLQWDRYYKLYNLQSGSCHVKGQSSPNQKGNITTPRVTWCCNGCKVVGVCTQSIKIEWEGACRLWMDSTMLFHGSNVIHRDGKPYPSLMLACWCYCESTSWKGWVVKNCRSEN